LAELSIRHPKDPCQHEVALAHALARVEEGRKIIVHSDRCPVTVTGVCLCDPKITQPMVRC
jgi:hypothetical protein